MVRYFYAWTPLVIVGAVVILSLPWLGLIALMVVSLVALAALTGAIVAGPYVLSRAVGRRWQGRSGANPQTAALSPAEHQNTELQAPNGRNAICGSDNPKSRVVLASRKSADHAPSTARNTDDGEPDAAPTSQALFVIPTRRGDGFRASIRGHLLELAEPTGHGLAPTPDDLFIVSIGSDLAWCTRRFLRDHGLTEDVNVSVAWRTLENPPRLADISVTVVVSQAAETMSDALMAAVEERVAARSLDDALRLHLHCRG